MYNSKLKHEYENIHGKIAVISDENNLPSALLAVKNINYSEIDLYIELKDTTILVNDIKSLTDNIACYDNPVFKYNVSEIFSPFEYNAVICISNNDLAFKIADTCKAYATPFIHDITIQKAKIA